MMSMMILVTLIMTLHTLIECQSLSSNNISHNKVSNTRPPWKTIKIGALLDFNSTSGRLARLALQIAVRDVNRDPTILPGIHLHLLALDTGSDAFLGAIAAIELLNREVVALAGPQSSRTSPFIAHLARAKQIPLVSFGATDPTLTQQHYSFIRTAHNDASQMKAIAAILLHYRWMEVIALYSDDDYGTNGITALGYALEEMGAQVTLHKVNLNPEINEYGIGSVLSDLSLMFSRVFIVHMPQNMALKVFFVASHLEMMSSGNAWIITDSLGATLDLMYQDVRVVKSTEGVIGTRSYIPDSWKLQHFTSEWEKAKGNQGIWNDLNSYALYAYDSLWVIALAINSHLRGGRNLRFENPLPHRDGLELVDLKVLVDGMALRQSILETEWDGTSGPIRFNANGDRMHSAFEIVNMVGRSLRVVGYWSNATGLSVSPPKTVCTLSSSKISLSSSSSSNESINSCSSSSSSSSSDESTMSSSSKSIVSSSSSSSNESINSCSSSSSSSSSDESTMSSSSSKSIVSSFSSSFPSYFSSSDKRTMPSSFSSSFSCSDKSIMSSSSSKKSIVSYSSSSLLSSFYSFNKSTIFSSSSCSSSSLSSLDESIMSSSSSSLCSSSCSSFSSTTYESTKLRTVIWPGGSTRVPRGWTLPHNGKPLLIGVPQKPGFQDLISASLDANNMTIFQGFCIHIFEEVIKYLPYSFNHEFILFGGGNEMPVYDELIDELANKVFDAVVADVTITSERLEKVDFSQPFIESDLVILVPPMTHRLYILWDFLRPFTPSLWLTVLLFLLFTGAMIWMLEHKDNPQFRGPPRNQIVTTFWFIFSTIFFSHQESTISVLGKVVVIVWLFVILIIKAGYTASLTLILTMWHLSPPNIQSLDTLLASDVPIGYQTGSFVKDYLINLGVEPKRMKPLGSKSMYAKALQLGPYDGGVAAIVDELPYINLFLNTECNYTIAGQEFTKAGWGFAFPKHSPLTLDISEAILRMGLNGELQKIIDIYFEKSECKSASNQQVQLEVIGLSHFWGLFLSSGLITLICLMLHIFKIIREFKRIRLTSNSNYPPPSNSRFQRITAWIKDLCFYADQRHC